MLIALTYRFQVGNNYAKKKENEELVCVYISGENLLLSYLAKQPNASRLFLFFLFFLSFFKRKNLNQMKTNPFLSCVLKVEERISVNRKEKSRGRERDKP